MRSTLLVAGLIAVLAASAMASDVVDVKDSNFEDVINSNEFVLIEFYAPWCGHCKKLAPEWETAATALKGQAVVAKLDATAEPQNAAKYEVRGYPTIKVFRDGKLAGDYEGQRTADAIVKYVKGNSGPAVAEIAGAEDLEKLKNDNSVVAVLFDAEADSHASKIFNEVAKKLRSSFKFATSASALSEKSGSIVIFKQFDEPREEFSGELSEENLANFVNSAGIRLFDEIGPENYKMYMERGLPMGWLFVTPGAETTDAVKAAAAKVAKSFKGKISFIWIDAAKYGGMAQRLGLKGDQFPAFAVDHAGSHYVFDESKPITETELEAFVQSYLSGALSQTVRSEKEPAEHTVDGLTTVVGTTFESLVLKAETDVLIEFYAPWCGHCKQLAPIFAKVAKAVNGRVRIAQIDATANDFPQTKFNVQGFPTIYFIKQGGDAKQYEGDRSFDGFAKYLSDNSGVTISE